MKAQDFNMQLFFLFLLTKDGADFRRRSIAADLPGLACSGKGSRYLQELLASPAGPSIRSGAIEVS